MSAQNFVRKGDTVRYENATGVVSYLRVASVTSQSAIKLDALKGQANINAVPKTYTSKAARYAWVNA